MNTFLFFTVLGTMAILSLWMGKKASKGTETNEDYFLMGRGLGLSSLVMTVLATQLGGGFLLGAAEEAYAQGWKVLFYPLGMALGLLTLGLGFGAKMRKLGLTTVAEIFEKVYRSARLRQTASLLSVAALFCILVGQGIAARKFFISLGFESNVFFVLFWGSLVFYTVMGGLRAVVKTDILQAGFIIGVLLLSFGVAQSGDVIPAATAVVSEVSSVPWLTWLVMPLCFMIISQDMGQRCFAARSPKTVSKAFCIAAAVLLVCAFLPIYFGSLAATLGLDIPEGGSSLLAATGAMCGPTVTTLLTCGVLMAIISTADSLLCSISSNLACDFPWLKGRSVKTSKALTFGVGMGALVISYFFNNIVAMLMFSYEFYVSALAVAVIAGVVMKTPRLMSAYVSVALGGGGFVLFRQWPVALALSLVGFSLTHFFLKWREGRPVVVDR